MGATTRQSNNSDTTPGNGGENTGKDDATVPGNGDGNGQVPPGQTEDDEGGIKNPAGHYPPGLNRGKKPDKPENPDKPGKPENPGTEDKSDRKAQKGEHIYEYNKNGWVTQGTVAKETTSYTYDTLGNLVQEKCKNTVIDYQYNILNQLVSRSDKNDSVTFTYDKRGNRVAEAGKKATEAYIYDATNHLVEGTNWQGDKSAYTYNGLFVRVQNTQTTHSGQVYDREFVIDYNSFERNDLMVFSAGYYEQKHIYTAWGERMEQFTERGNWDRLLYVHEDIMGNTRYYTKDNGQSFAELEYDVWGAVTSPSKLNNNDNGNFAAAVFTGHPYDTVLDVYFAEARFYDANHRQWMSVDPIKESLNWYWYANGNPATYWDYNGLFIVAINEHNDVIDGTELKRGAISKDVIEARKALVKADTDGNYMIAYQENPNLAGIFDYDMEEAVRRFQKDNNLPATGTIDAFTWLRLGLDYNTTLQEEFGLSHIVDPNNIFSPTPTVNVGIRENEHGREEIVIQYFPVFYIQGMRQFTTTDALGQEYTFNALLPVDGETYKEYASTFYKSINEAWGNLTVNIQGIEADVVLEMDESMRKGTAWNNNVHIILEKGQNIVWDAFLWRKDSDLRINLREATPGDIEEAARHEFGHVVGNFDAYGYNQNDVGKFFFKGLEHNPDGSHVLDSVGEKNIMDFFNPEAKVEAINVEMMLYAFSENRLQPFYTSIVGGTSQAFYH